MSDFAKIVRATDGAQVLFYKTMQNDCPAITQVTDAYGVLAEITAQFNDKAMGWGDRELAFEKASVEEADAVRKAALFLLSRRTENDDHCLGR